jgi:hypothetical protein
MHGLGAGSAMSHDPGTSNQQCNGGSGTGYPTVVGGQDFWWIGTTVDQSAAIVNSGLRTTFEVTNVPPAKGCIDTWTSETLDNGVWATASGLRSATARTPRPPGSPHSTKLLTRLAQC